MADNEITDVASIWPDMVYHGTGQRHAFLSFDCGDDRTPDGLGLWFTEDRSTAVDFAVDRSKRANGMPCILAAEIEISQAYVVSSFEALKCLVQDSSQRSAKGVRKHLLAQGYDVIIIDRSCGSWKDDARDFILLSPNTIREYRWQPLEASIENGASPSP